MKFGEFEGCLRLGVHHLILPVGSLLITADQANQSANASSISTTTTMVTGSWHGHAEGNVSERKPFVSADPKDIWIGNGLQSARQYLETLELAFGITFTHTLAAAAAALNGAKNTVHVRCTTPFLVRENINTECLFSSLH